MPEIATPPAAPKPAAPPAEPVVEAPSFVTRDVWLAQAGRLKEKIHEVEGFGRVLLTEITGAARAAIQTTQSSGLLADAKRIDVAAYQRALLLAGVLDPNSPEGARRPLFSAGDMDAVMKVGGSKIESIVTEIEKLSGLGQFQTSAEGNSDATPSDAGTSG